MKDLLFTLERKFWERERPACIGAGKDARSPRSTTKIRTQILNTYQ